MALPRTRVCVARYHAADAEGGKEIRLCRQDVSRDDGEGIALVSICLVLTDLRLETQTHALLMQPPPRSSQTLSLLF